MNDVGHDPGIGALGARIGFDVDQRARDIRQDGDMRSIAAATGAWRIVYGARTFGVVGLPRNIDEAGRWLVFDCVERI